MISVAVVAALATGFVSGCAGPQSSNGSASNGANAPAATNPAAGSNAPSSDPFDPNTTATGNAAAGDAQVIAQFKTVATDLVRAYVNAHNDKTLAQYKVDVSQILIPGLAQGVASLAKSGVDYNHPMTPKQIQISDVEPQNNYQFRARADVTLQYPGGKTEQVTYHVMCIQDQSSQQWLIESIG